MKRVVCIESDGVVHVHLDRLDSNRSNAFALADDMMEPYRPFVDITNIPKIKTLYKIKSGLGSGGLA